VVCSNFRSLFFIVLDQIIDDFADLIRNHYDLKAEFGDPSASTDVRAVCLFFHYLVTRAQEEVVVVGRITHDPETVVKSKLMEGAIFIESSRMYSGGARVPLRFDSAMKIRGGVKGSGGFGLFPGKVAAFKGKNGGGGYFLATEYLSVSYSTNLILACHSRSRSRFRLSNPPPLLLVSSTQS